jgi:hypothetical protein
MGIDKDEYVQVFLKGDARTPQRFWSYALGTTDEHRDMYEGFGYVYSEKHTEEYKSLKLEDQDKVRFVLINGVRQL